MNEKKGTRGRQLEFYEVARNSKTYKKAKNLKVSIVMGSQSDYKTMKQAVKILKTLSVKIEIKIINGLSDT